MQLLKHFHEISLHPNNAKELKGLILQLAVQGKLTKKWRQENQVLEDTSRLIEEIKQFNIEQLLLKKRRVNKPQIENEIYLNIPRNWIQVRNFELFSLFKGKNPKDLSESVKKYPYQDIESLDRENVRRYSDDEKAPKCTDSDILVVCDGSRSGLVLDGRAGIVGSTLAIIETPPFIKDFVKLIFLQNFQRVNSNMKGAAIPHLDTKSLLVEAIGLPPLKEQKAIVKTVEQLFKEVEQLEALTVERIQLKEKFATSALNQLTINNTVKEWKDLKPHFHTFFNEEPNIKKLRETILQLAVQGKLTAHWRKSNPVIESAEKLLERIREEKEQLVKDKKIKKEKPLHPISKDEIPYALPEGWVWCRIGAILNVKSSKRVFKSDYVKEGVPFFRSKEIGQLGRGESVTTELFISRKKFDEYKKNFGVTKASDILIACIGGSIGNTWLVDNREFYYKDGNLVQLDSIPQIDSFYMLKYLDSKIFYNSALGRVSGSAYKALTIEKIKNSIFPLPPENEQKAIVEKVNNLMAFCDSLEQEVKQSKVEVENLMKGVLREVLS